MMYWYGDGPQWWMFVLMMLIVVPLWIAAAVAIISISGLGRPSEKRSDESTRLAPEALLAERFASGDIDETEYLHRLAVLRPTSAQPVGVNQ
ncbi:SHOCT domain-containing protein [Nocardia sp. NPDC046473]|uniref:SHOCT domain-containing protein n=1 Tax=Nocardia sp. NPDC046473 TaxID=3155733 RepID=UPI0033EAEF3D